MKRELRIALCRVGKWVFMGCLAPLMSLSLAAQVPEEFKNLKVLPADIEQPALVEVMRGFATSLGVRCQGGSE